MCVLGAFILSAATTAGASELVAYTTVFNGQTRNYLVYVPDGYVPEQPTPLVLAMHQFASNGPAFAAVSGWTDTADRVGCLVVFPTGGIVAMPPLQWIWNIWRFDEAPPPDGAFLIDLVDEVASNYTVDRARVYATGFSNGGMMSATLACRYADTFAAIAPVASGWITAYNPPESQCQPSVGIPVWQWRGEYENALVSGNPPHALPRTVQDAQQRSFWITTNRVKTPPRSFTYIYDGPQLLTLETSIYAPMPNDPMSAEYRYTQVRNWGHAYFPGASDLIWDEFFSRFAREVPCEPPAQSGFELVESWPDNATVRVSADASADGTVFHWARGGQPITDGPTGWGSTVSGSATGVLSIASFGLADEGLYTCSAENGCERVYSNKLDVRAGPCPGDLNGDHRFDARDVAEFVKRVIEPPEGLPGLPSIGEFLSLWAGGGC